MYQTLRFNVENIQFGTSVRKKVVCFYFRSYHILVVLFLHEVFQIDT